MHDGMNEWNEGTNNKCMNGWVKQTNAWNANEMDARMHGFVNACM